jgi:hypothetical protein
VRCVRVSTVDPTRTRYVIHACTHLYAHTLHPGQQSASCVDVHAFCPYWASTGECAANAGFMRVACKASCNTCGSTQDELVRTLINTLSNTAAPAPVQPLPLATIAPQQGRDQGPVCVSSVLCRLWCAHLRTECVRVTNRPFTQLTSACRWRFGGGATFVAYVSTLFIPLYYILHLRLSIKQYRSSRCMLIRMHGYPWLVSFEVCCWPACA